MSFGPWESTETNPFLIRLSTEFFTCFSPSKSGLSTCTAELMLMLMFWGLNFRDYVQTILSVPEKLHRDTVATVTQCKMCFALFSYILHSFCNFHFKSRNVSSYEMRRPFMPAFRWQPGLEASCFPVVSLSVHPILMNRISQEHLEGTCGTNVYIFREFICQFFN